ncbi:hypothetical protein CEXT_618731 [Caerostris extrusa]|uniref:Uncharacterized protein n=1 Tax=Caerostris extrusa TaxID=172846 RepID=A0AAV4WWE5_CAEEX|nr:hypothetical protein CEXT_618731 [Caerostris extrusa]
MASSYLVDVTSIFERGALPEHHHPEWPVRLILDVADLQTGILHFWPEGQEHLSFALEKTRKLFQTSRYFGRPDGQLASPLAFGSSGI